MYLRMRTLLGGGAKAKFHAVFPVGVSKYAEAAGSSHARLAYWIHLYTSRSGPQYERKHFFSSKSLYFISHIAMQHFDQQSEMVRNIC